MATLGCAACGGAINACKTFSWAFSCMTPPTPAKPDFPKTLAIDSTGAGPLTLRDSTDLAAARVLPKHEEPPLCFAPDGRLGQADVDAVLLCEPHTGTVVA